MGTWAEVVQEAIALHDKKRAGYAPGPDEFANFRMAEHLGMTALDGVLVRMSDKWARIGSLRRNPDNDRVRETLRDTLMDFGVYAFIAVALLDEEMKNGLVADRGGPCPVCPR